MKAKIIEIEEIGFPNSLVCRENAPISELINTEELINELFGLVKKLNLQNVSQQRELLNAFVDNYNKDACGSEVISEYAVDDFLKGVL